MATSKYQEIRDWMKLGMVVTRPASTPPMSDPLGGKTNAELTDILNYSASWHYHAGIGYLGKDFLEQPHWPFFLEPLSFSPPAGGVWFGAAAPSGQRHVSAPPLIIATFYTINTGFGEMTDYYLYFFPVGQDYIRAYKMAFAGGIVPVLLLPLLSFAAVACTASSSPPGRRRKS